MNVRPIHTEIDYNKALSRIEQLFDSVKGTAEGDELEVLSILVEDYEQRYFPIESPPPLDAILFRLDQMGLNQTDFAKIIGSRSRASEIMAGKRRLSLRTIRLLHDKLSIPAEVLIGDR
jgi:HTH-type transcriptional regulator / antitoxin HigA